MRNGVKGALKRRNVLNGREITHNFQIQRMITILVFLGFFLTLHYGSQIASIYSILRKRKRYFVPVGDIPPIKRYLCSMLVNASSRTMVVNATTSVSTSKQAQLCAKSNLLPDFGEKKQR